MIEGSNWQSLQGFDGNKKRCKKYLEDIATAFYARRGISDF